MANYIPEFSCYYCLLEWEGPKYILIQNANDIFSNAVRPRMPHFQWKLSCNYLSVFLDIRGTARLRDQSGYTVKVKKLIQWQNWWYCFCYFHRWKDLKAMQMNQNRIFSFMIKMWIFYRGHSDQEKECGFDERTFRDRLALENWLT